MHQIFPPVTLSYFFRFIPEDLRHQGSFPVGLTAVFFFFTGKKQAS
jgi:hypothetical protein